jgi:hypothetical protein
VKRLQIMIEEDIDAALGRQATEEAVSKAALIRRYVRTGFGPCRLWRRIRSGGSSGSPATASRWWTSTSFCTAPAARSDLRRLLVLDRSAVREAQAFDDDFAAAGFVELRA